MEPPSGPDYVSPVPPRSPGSARLRWIGVLVGFAVLVGVVLLQRQSGNAPAARPAPVASSFAPTSAGPTPTSIPTTTAQSGTPAGPANSTPGPDLPTSRPVSSAAELAGMAATVATVPAGTLPRTADWALVGFGGGRVVRIDSATGRVTVIPGSSLPTENSAQTMIATAGVTFVGGWGTPGWIVSDGGPATVAEHELADASQVIPGPDPLHLWTVTSQLGGDVPAVFLVGWDGHATGSSIILPAHLRYGGVGPDGAGNILARGVGGYYDVTPATTRLITHGTVVATGPTGFLAYECGDTPRCQAVVIDRRSWSRRVIAGLTLDGADTGPVGVMSADGARAAFLQVGFTTSAMAVRLRLVDLSTGTSTFVLAAIDGNAAYSWSAGFSPDGKHLAVILEGGAIGIVDTASGDVHGLRLPPSVPPLTALTTQMAG